MNNSNSFSQSSIENLSGWLLHLGIFLRLALEKSSLVR